MVYLQLMLLQMILFYYSTELEIFIIIIYSIKMYF